MLKIGIVMHLECETTYQVLLNHKIEALHMRDFYYCS